MAWERRGKLRYFYRTVWAGGRAEKRYFGRLLFRPDPALHAEQFKIVNVATNEELASVGG